MNETLSVEDSTPELFDALAGLLLPILLNLALIGAWWWRGDFTGWLLGASLALLAIALVLRGAAGRPFIRHLASLICLVTLAACVGMAIGQQLWLAGWDALDQSPLFKQLEAACGFGLVLGWCCGMLLILRLSGARLVEQSNHVLALGPLFILPLTFSGNAAAMVADGRALWLVSALCAGIAWSLWRYCKAWKALPLFFTMGYLLGPVMGLAWPYVDTASGGVPVALLGLLAVPAFYAAGWRQSQGRLVFALAVVAGIPFTHYALLQWGAVWAAAFLLAVGLVFWQLAGRFALSPQVVSELMRPKPVREKVRLRESWSTLRGICGVMFLCLLLGHLLLWAKIAAEEPRPTRAALDYFSLITAMSDGAIDPARLIPARVLVARLFEEEYLWPDKVHAHTSKDTASTVAAELAASVKRKDDPYSRGLQSGRHAAWISGRPVGMGMYFDRDKAGWWIAEVLRDSPAEAAGVKKGMRLLELDGEPVGETLPMRWRELREWVAGKEVRLLVSSGKASGESATAVAATTARKIVVRSGPIRLASQVVAQILPSERGPVGFLAFPSFDKDSWIEIEAKLDAFLAAGVKEMVIDLSGNPGGMSVLATRLASRLVSPINHGAPFIHWHHRPRWERFDYQENLDVPVGRTLALRRLYVLTSMDTCSTSELLITGLRPYLEVVQIGFTTCGKPYGMHPFAIGDEVLTLVVNESRNARNEAYRDGLHPDCFDFEVVLHSLDSSKPLAENVMVKHALQHINSGKCRPIR
ncbi:S41 family peptidase [Propionivibrio sp.]|uniref:S41 family peptidase n=1 Tax=Propionivibrio sp. TaxID=2212460 RepID=UPI003BF0BEC4